MEAAINMLEDVLKDCPDELWAESLWTDKSAPEGLADFWYLAYHTLFMLDLNLSGSLEGFVPPEPFTLSELDPAGVLPDQIYTRAVLLGYLDHCREKSRAIIQELTDEQAQRKVRFPWLELPFGELFLYNMRHVQEHGAQLRMFLGQKEGINARWLGK